MNEQGAGEKRAGRSQALFALLFVTELRIRFRLHSTVVEKKVDIDRYCTLLRRKKSSARNVFATGARKGQGTGGTD